MLGCYTNLHVRRTENQSAGYCDVECAMKPLMYEWDEAKRRSNQIKHNVDFTVIEAFDWNTALINASQHGSELRFVAMGYIETRLHVVVYTQTRE